MNIEMDLTTHERTQVSHSCKSVLDLTVEDMFRIWVLSIIVKRGKQDRFLLETLTKMAEGGIGQVQFH